MGQKVNLRILLAGTLAVAMLVASCTSSTSDTDLLSTATSAVAPETDETTSGHPPDLDGPDEAAITAMCRTLDLLSSAGVLAGRASASMDETDLKAFSSVELAAYGDTLMAAPRVACPEHIDYADEIAYWLGF
jgi:hypothetical protein